MQKTMSFAIIHFSVAFTVGYLISGSLVIGGAIALVEPVINTIAYHFHELAWRQRDRHQLAKHRNLMDESASYV